MFHSCRGAAVSHMSEIVTGKLRVHVERMQRVSVCRNLLNRDVRHFANRKKHRFHLPSRSRARVDLLFRPRVNVDLADRFHRMRIYTRQETGPPDMLQQAISSIFFFQIPRVFGSLVKAHR